VSERRHAMGDVAMGILSSIPLDRRSFIRQSVAFNPEQSGFRQDSAGIQIGVNLGNSPQLHRYVDKVVERKIGDWDTGILKR
jgi:hypothetical protein